MPEQTVVPTNVTNMRQSIVKKTSTTTLRQLSAHRPARLHAFSTRVVFSITPCQHHLRISSFRPKLVPIHRTNLVGLADHRAHAWIFVARIQRASNFLNCVALQVLELVHHSSRCSTFVAFSVSRVFPATHLAAVVHLMCAPILRLLLLAQQPAVPQRTPLFVSYKIINTLCTVGFHPVRWCPQRLVDILRINCLRTSSYISMFT